MNDVNLIHLSPEIALVVTALAVVLLDMTGIRKGLLAAVAVLGVLASGAMVLGLWGVQGTSFNGALAVDQFALFFKLLVLGSVFLVVLSSQDYVGRFAKFIGEYYGLILLAGAGMMLTAGARELITIYLAIELTSFSIVALAAMLKETKSSESALKYLIPSAISSAVMLYGMALVFGMTGSTQLSDIAAGLRETTLLENPTLTAGFLFMVAGFGFKIAAVPFQMWVPDVYEGAPTPVTAFLSVASKAAGFAVLLRVFMTAFPAFEADWRDLFAALAIASMFVGNLVAMAQTNIKRLLGYSTIAHAGYIMIGIAAGGSLGQSGVLFYLAVYAITNLGAFIAVIALANRSGSEDINSFAGLGRAAPFPALVLALCLVSLTGVPPTAGFMGKVYLFNGAVQSGLGWLAVVGVVNSVLSIYYYWRVIRVMYQEKDYALARRSDSLPLQASLGLALVGVLLLGVAPQTVINWAVEAINTLQAAAVVSGL